MDVNKETRRQVAEEQKAKNRRRAIVASEARLRVKSVPLGDGDDWLPCPGSGICHGMAYLQITQGKKTKFVKCGISRCNVVLWLSGSAWEEKFARDGRIGVTRAEIARDHPGALIL